MRSGAHTVVEYPGYLSWVLHRFGAGVRDIVLDDVGANPQAGNVIVGSGGVRKRRVALPGGGKSGGIRVLTAYFHVDAPVFILAGLAKSDRTNISDGEKAVLRALMQQLKSEIPMRKNTGRAPSTETRETPLGQELIRALRWVAAGAPGATLVARPAAPDVKQLRAQLGLTQAAMARACGVSTAAVRNWEQGRNKPRGAAITVLRALAAR